LKLKNDPSKDVKSLIRDIEVPGGQEPQTQQVNGTATEIATEKVQEPAPATGTRSFSPSNS